MNNKNLGLVNKDGIPQQAQESEIAKAVMKHEDNKNAELKEKKREFLKDPDYTGFKPIGKHVVFIEPDEKTKSGIILPEGTNRSKVEAQETFDENVFITCMSDECDKDLKVGDHLMINFHAQVVDFSWKGIPHIMLHQDYVLARYRSSEEEKGSSIFDIQFGEVTPKEDEE